MACGLSSAKLARPALAAASSLSASSSSNLVSRQSQRSAVLQHVTAFWDCSSVACDEEQVGLLSSAKLARPALAAASSSSNLRIQESVSTVSDWAAEVRLAHQE